MALAGLEGQPVDVYKYFEDTGVDGYNLVASPRRVRLVIGILLELGNAAYSWNNGLRAAVTTVGRRDPRVVRPVPAAAAQLRRRPGRARSTEPLHDIRGSIRRRAGARRTGATDFAASPAPAGAGAEPARARGRRRARGRERGSNQARHLRRRDLLGSLIAMPNSPLVAIGTSWRAFDASSP